MSLPRYPAYKDSGVSWLGEVPVHWEVGPCRSIVDEQSVKNEGAINQNYLSLMANVGVIPYEEKGDVGNKKPEDLSKCKLVAKGDLVINSMNYGIGSYGISNFTGVCSPVYIVLRPKLQIVKTRYAYRIFENRAFQTYAQSFGNGILEHRSAINWDVLKGINVGIPPLEEQGVILDFLDRETAKIDALIAEQEKLIALLAEKRQATISRAVTSGLDPNVPLKDSGVPWLGKVPAHWEVTALKRFWAVTDCKHVTAEFVESGFPLASIREVQSRYVDLREAKQTSQHFYDLLIEGGRKPQSGDLIFSRNATVGEVSQVTDEHPQFALGQDVCLLRKKESSHSSDFLQAVIQSRVVVEQLGNIMVGSTFKRVNVEDIRELVIAMPPSNEQSDIAMFVEREVKRLENLNQSFYLAIGLLKERRAALISAAVTGKIDVRGLAA